FQAEDGIRDLIVTGVQTCALPISLSARAFRDVSALPALAIEEIADPSVDMIGLFHSRSLLRKFQANCSNKDAATQKMREAALPPPSAAGSAGILPAIVEYAHLDYQGISLLTKAG